MAAVPVANAWPTGKSAIPIPQFRPSNCSCLDFSSISTAGKASSSNLRMFTKSPIVVIVNNHHRRDSKLLCRCSTTNGDASTSTTTSAAAGNLTTSDWDWNRWNRHFTEVEQAERCVSLLKFQLEEAIENEDFEEAKKLKIAIGESTLMDSVAEIMSELKNAVDEERYHDASKLCRNTGSGLVGWWVGYSKDSDDPFGRIVRITPGVGRFVGRSYNPRQLVSASSGTPLFEIFVVKDTDANYTMQVVFLQRSKMSIVKPASPVSLRSPKAPSAAAVENASVIDVQIGEDNVQNDDASTETEGVTEDSIIDEIRGVTKFLKDKLPELKLENFKIMKVNSFEDITEDVKQLIEDYDESDSEDEKSDVDESHPDQIPQEEDNDTIKEGKDPDVKLFLGGVLHNKEDMPPRDEYVRVPAEIEEMERDSFMLHVPARSRDQNTEASIASKVKIAAIAAQGISDLMPAAVAKALWNSDKISPKVSRNVREIVKLAINQAKKGEKLSEFTNFSRISTSRGELDPFDGLYVGAFGPYGTEVVQLRRKYGNWGMNDEFFEYVEAVKLTGDLNVPAGQVTFRAKVAKGNRFSSRGKYPEEFGVVASHSGQGRIADFGFKNPKWVSGELLLLNGKGMGPYAKGADLGFLYLIPDQSFLVLFNRLKLPE